MALKEQLDIFCNYPKSSLLVRYINTCVKTAIRKSGNKPNLKSLLRVTTSNRFISLKDSEDGLPKEHISRNEKVHKKAKHNKRERESDIVLTLFKKFKEAEIKPSEAVTQSAIFKM